MNSLFYMLYVLIVRDVRGTPGEFGATLDLRGGIGVQVCHLHPSRGGVRDIKGQVGDLWYKTVPCDTTQDMPYSHFKTCLSALFWAAGLESSSCKAGRVLLETFQCEKRLHSCLGLTVLRDGAWARLRISRVGG